MSKTNDQPNGAFNSWTVRWSERRRQRVADRSLWREKQRAHLALLEQAKGVADFHTWKAFYADDENRRGDDVKICEVADVELRWTICWLPRTGEVVAFSADWLDPRWHHLVTDRPTTDSGGGGFATIATAPVPELVCLLGPAATVEQARVQLASVSTLAECRAALGEVAP